MDRVQTINYFRQQKCYQGLIRLPDTLRKIKTFVNEVTQLKVLRKYLHANKIKGEFEILNHMLDSNITDLSFALTYFWRKWRKG
ncbi:hypothetical protein RhiirA4_390763 [Rhizophagus irregularis]|uniref:Uncharacterized protein n=1 Tax=Rhizophagus irregularis TaxID=588596 RepID=A0A2I1FTH2_9GLOM|nr:hypothetical protein RhiirA4_390763 [Rhizophagus irregularis]